MLLDVGFQFLGLGCAQDSNRFIVASLGKSRKLHENVVEEKREPHAFALAMLADEVHSVVPIAASHQRQPVFAEAQSMVDGPNTMLVQRGGLFGPDGQVVIAVLLGLRGRPSRNWTFSSRTPVSPSAATYRHVA